MTFVKANGNVEITVTLLSQRVSMLEGILLVT